MSNINGYSIAPSVDSFYRTFMIILCSVILSCLLGVYWAFVVIEAECIDNGEFKGLSDSEYSCDIKTGH